MHAFRYALDESLASMWRGRRSGLLSVGTIAVALFVLGTFLLILSNLERLGQQWGAAPEMSVYLADEISASDRADIERLLTPGPVVARAEYVSKDEAARRFKDLFTEAASAIDGAQDNPLPASYEVTLRPDVTSAGRLDTLTASLRKIPGVEDVRDDREWLDRWHRTVRGIETVGLSLSAALAIAAAMTVGMVVRLALHARRDELEIMELVGAPRVYLRGPFVMEGVLHGGLGAVAALVALGAAFVALRPRYLNAAARAVNLDGVLFLPPRTAILMLLGGMAIGCVAGLLAGRARA